jgi:hypothetical protein
MGLTLLGVRAHRLFAEFRQGGTAARPVFASSLRFVDHLSLLLRRVGGVNRRRAHGHAALVDRFDQLGFAMR